MQQSSVELAKTERADRTGPNWILAGGRGGAVVVESTPTRSAQDPRNAKAPRNRRALTFATLLQLLSLLGSNVNRVKKHRWLGEEDLNRIYMYHLSQGVSLTLPA